MIGAVEHGQPEVIKWLHTHRGEPQTTKLMETVAAHGHLNIVQWLHEHRSEGCTTKAMDSAAQNGHLHVVQWLHEYRREVCTSNAMDDAAQGGHLEVVTWLHENRSEGCSELAMDGSDWDVCAWLHHNQSEGCSTHAIGDAACEGNVQKILFLRDIGYDGVKASAIQMAAQFGHLHILVWALEHCPEQFDSGLVGQHSHPHINEWLDALSVRESRHARPDEAKRSKTA